MSPSQPLQLWLINDNKPGHRNQLEGLANALADLKPLEHQWYDAGLSLSARFQTIVAMYKKAQIKKPDLIIAAGHKTHLLLLIGRFLFGGKSIVLMRPSLPLRLFDLALIPQHDGHFHQNNVISTLGAINKITPSQSHDKNIGLFLIGGPSKHHGWNSRQMAEQIETIIDSAPDIRWKLTTSRRTPGDFLPLLKHLNNKLAIIPHTETGSDWLPDQLCESGFVWVSEDSVSMIYEALTSGASTGLLEVPILKNGRIQQGIQDLLTSKALYRVTDWLNKTNIPHSGLQLNEAHRCAELILKHFNYVE
ncbi:MAG: mitochondrial fission ELM1 family protein [Methylicorpusculum sp.]|uniref:mitochondrial fission ELM1 family protein n=1 Tax=Methylicorpusculum sp. TaxID=2713644 RepID=UPI00271BE0D8|nr:mitochondrial fission ELM1 family protein [Methylicorpusculum sp.]MDO8940069.1 mitochondrial fission ELM1 family protein [Methylicorpusculum sp.]MDP2201450.1 mitochondrial fission ELM1 family protein [Methylicorpusculum sp.]